MNLTLKSTPAKFAMIIQGIRKTQTSLRKQVNINVNITIKKQAYKSNQIDQADRNLKSKFPNLNIAEKVIE